MRISDLTLFALAAQHGSLSAAGREIGLSPAAASARLTALEKELGTTLMARTTRSLSLTEDGTRFLAHASRALEEIDAGRAALATSDAEPSGTLRAALPGPFGRKHILPFLPEFRERYPKVTIDMHLSDQMVSLVDEGFDLGIRIGVLRDSSLIRTRLAPNRRMVVASPAFVARHGMPARPEDCAALDAIVQTGLTFWHFTKGEQRAEVRVSGPIRSNNGAVLLDAALMGIGIALKSVWDVGTHLQDGTLVDLLPDWTCEEDGAIHAVRPPSPYTPTKVRAFIDFLREKYGPQPYWETMPQK